LNLLFCRTIPVKFESPLLKDNPCQVWISSSEGQSLSSLNLLFWRTISVNFESPLLKDNPCQVWISSSEGQSLSSLNLLFWRTIPVKFESPPLKFRITCVKFDFNLVQQKKLKLKKLMIKNRWTEDRLQVMAKAHFAYD
jgi:hypothetical protein